MKVARWISSPAARAGLAYRLGSLATRDPERERGHKPRRGTSGPRSRRKAGGNGADTDG